MKDKIRGKYRNIIDKFKDSKNVCLIAHLEPDTDALSSMVVFRAFLEKTFGLNVDIFADSEILPANYMPIIEGIKLNPKVKKYDTAVMMDSPNLDRLGKYKDLFENAKKTFVIDHHSTNNYNGEYNIVEIVSSTCEIVYKILAEYDYQMSVAEYGKIYEGLITDTNSFSVGAITSDTFKIASVCSEFIDVHAINANFFNSNTLVNMRLFAKAIENMKVYEDGKIIISAVKKSEMSKIHANFNDFTGIINRMATIENSQLICLIQPKDNDYYVSMRANNGYDVSIIAKENGGGGHIGASAFISDRKIAEIESLILEEFTRELKSKKPSKSKLF